MEGLLFFVCAHTQRYVTNLGPVAERCPRFGFEVVQGLSMRNMRASAGAKD
jgi:hypothetical protein